MRQHNKFGGDRSNRCRDMAIFRFFKMRPSAILDLFYACLGHPGSAHGGLYRCAKFDWNQRCNFEDMRFSIFLLVRLENSYSQPFSGVLGENGGKWDFLRSYPCTIGM